LTFSQTKNYVTPKHALVSIKRKSEVLVYNLYKPVGIIVLALR